MKIGDKTRAFIKELRKETSHLDWIINFVIPFLNADKAELKHLIERYFQLQQRQVAAVSNLLEDHFKGYRRSTDEENRAATERLKKELNQSGTSARLSSLQEALRAMIEIALLSKSGQPIAEKTIKKIADIEKALEAGKIEAVWRGYGETYCRQTSDWQTNLEDIEHNSLAAVAHAFESIPQLLSDEISEGPGFALVGVCPNCKKIFQKKRKDQEYCSAKCQKAAGMRRVREDKKAEK